MNLLKKMIPATLCAIGLSANAATPREFGYLHEADPVNRVDKPMTYPDGNVDIQYWTNLTHGALLGQPNWAVFVSPILGKGTTDTVSPGTFLPPGISEEPLDYVDLLINYGPSGSWTIGRQTKGMNGLLFPEGYFYSIAGTLAVGVVESSSTLLIDLQNIGPLAPSDQRYLIDHVLLNGHPEAVPILSYRGSRAIDGDYTDFCSQLSYDVVSSRWQIRSLCTFNASRGWNAVDVAIHVAPAEEGLRHTVTAGNRWVGASCPALAQCSSIDNPMINGKGDAILIGTRGANARLHLFGFRYNEQTQRWMVVCLPKSEFGLPPATRACALHDNAQYHIWVPHAAPTSKTTTLARPAETSNFLRVTPGSMAPELSISMQGFLATALNGESSTGSNVNVIYNNMEGGWLLLPNAGTPRFFQDSDYAVHAFPPRQNAYLHKVRASSSAPWLSEIDHPLLRGNHANNVFVAQAVNNPYGMEGGGGNFLQNVGLYWDGARWSIALEAAAGALQQGSYYHVLFPTANDANSRYPAFRHMTSITSIRRDRENCSYLPLMDSNLRVFFNHVIDEPSIDPGMFIDSAFYTQYLPYEGGPSQAWAICRSDQNPMPEGAKFNVLVMQDQPINEGSEELFRDSFE